MWTEFTDMHSGGLKKTKWSYIYIELPEKQAVEYFENRFNLNPDFVTCPCCGSDFSVHEMDGAPEDGEGVLIISLSEVEQ